MKLNSLLLLFLLNLPIIVVNIISPRMRDVKMMIRMSSRLDSPLESPSSANTEEFIEEFNIEESMLAMTPCLKHKGEHHWNSCHVLVVNIC